MIRIARLIPNFLAAALLMLPLPIAAQALELTITEGVVGARPIAIVPFVWDGEGNPPEDIAEIVELDLARSGQFSPLERNDMVARPGVGDDIRFANWRLVGVDHVVVGRVQPGDGDGYTVRFQLFDVLAQRQVTGYSFTAQGPALRRVGHEISDIVYQEITGERGAFSTRIAFVTATRSGDDAEYTLLVSDYDGHNARRILSSSQPVLSPAWSPDGNRLAYVSFEDDRRPGVYVQDVRTGERSRVSARSGINSAPAWSPDGRSLALTLSHEGSPDLYILDLGNNRLRRLTNSAAIDTSPVWTPDGRQIVFTSDRAGGPQIYRMQADGRGNVERLTFDGRYNAAPDVSPDGSRVAFIHRTDNGHYRVAVQDLSNGIMRVLTDSRADESVSFAPNGRMILYSTQHDGRGVLGAVSVDGRASVRLSQARGNVREPAWSPFRE